MDIIDFYDETGAVTHLAAPRSERDHDKQWILAAHVWVVSDKGLLMQRRSPSRKTSPNRWDISVAGHVLTGQPPIEAAVREAREEMGIPVPQEELERVGRFKNRPHLCFIETFVLRREVPIESLSFNDSEVAEAKWISFDELRRSLAQNPAQFVERDGEFERILSAFS